MNGNKKIIKILERVQCQKKKNNNNKEIIKKNCNSNHNLLVFYTY